MTKIEIAHKEWIKLHSTGKTWIFKDHGRWGDNIAFMDGNIVKCRVYGHLTPLPEIGDKLEVDMASGLKLIFYFTKVEPCRDPSDMFFADIKLCSECYEANPDYFKE